MDTQKSLQSFNLDAQLFYDAISFSTDDYLYVMDMHANVTLVSDTFRVDFNLPDNLVENLIPLWREFIVERDKKRFDESIERMLQGSTNEHNIEYQVKNAKGELVWVACRGLLKRDEENNPSMFAGVISNLERKGKIDPVSGLLTHDECSNLLDRLVACSANGSVMLLGLDDFSRINALKDHTFGNSVLRMFAQSTQRLIPEGAHMFRLDGDLFAIVAEETTLSAMENLYQAIHVLANRSHCIDDTSYFCTTSAGIAMIDPSTHSGQGLLKNAQSALEESKVRGKNTVTLFSASMTEAKRRRLEISDHLQSSVFNDMEHFELHYQPLVEASKLKVKGAEALLRWKSEKLGRLSPGEFIPILESFGLIGQVGRWVFEQAASQCKQWLKSLPNFIMNINISYLQLLDPAFVPFVEKTLHRLDLAPQSIVLEMTESYFVTDMVALRTTFEHLHALNVQLAIDDFGTGCSSLGLLSQSPADIVKIDRLFIKDIHKDSFNRSFIDSVIELCHSVGIRVTVEGVEEFLELDAVRTIGADIIQGFIVSRPVPAGEFEDQFLAYVA